VNPAMPRAVVDHKCDIFQKFFYYVEVFCVYKRTTYIDLLLHNKI